MDDPAVDGTPPASGTDRQDESPPPQAIAGSASQPAAPPPASEPVTETSDWTGAAATEPAGLEGGWVPPAQGSTRVGRKTAAILAGIVALLAIPGLKLVSILLAASVVSGALGSVFGNAYDQLPANFRSGISTRLEAVVPADFDLRSHAQQVAWLNEQRIGGMVRLDDEALVRRFRLLEEGLRGMPVPACAEIVDAVRSGRMASKTTDDAFFAALAEDQRMEWVEFEVEAIEAQARGTPVPRIVNEDEVAKVYEAADRLTTPDESGALDAFNADTTPSDAVACSGVRAYNAVLLRLAATDLATVSRYNVQPQPDDPLPPRERAGERAHSRALQRRTSTHSTIASSPPLKTRLITVSGRLAVATRKTMSVRSMTVTPIPSARPHACPWKTPTAATRPTTPSSCHASGTGTSLNGGIGRSPAYRIAAPPPSTRMPAASIRSRVRPVSEWPATAIRCSAPRTTSSRPRRPTGRPSA